MAISAGGAGGGGTRRGRRRAHRAGAMSEINITPMVDVMLVLMVIFIVAAPMMVSGVPVKPPSTSAGPLAADNEPPLAISLDPEGKIYLMTTEVAEADLIPRLQAIAAERTSKKVYVRADGALSYERVMVIMGALSAAGFDDIGLVTDAGGPKLDGSDGQ
jgi:biopolymer transport protein TolR